MTSYMCSCIILVIVAACHMFSVIRIVSGRKVCWICLAKLGLFLWRTTQFVKSIQCATQAPSTRNPVPLKAQSFLHDSAWWYLHTETAFFWNRYPEWTFWIWRAWWICVDDWKRILLKSLRHKPGSSLLNENFGVENGGQQCCRLSSPVLLHALKSILLFWRKQLAISNSLRLWNLLVRHEGV